MLASIPRSLSTVVNSIEPLMFCLMIEAQRFNVISIHLSSFICKPSSSDSDIIFNRLKLSVLAPCVRII